MLEKIHSTKMKLIGMTYTGLYGLIHTRKSRKSGAIESLEAVA